MKIYLNGKIVDSSEAFISVFDRGYLFGEGLFETLRSYEGVVPFLDKHLERMEWAASFMGLSFPHPRELSDAVKNLLSAANLKEAKIKIVLSSLNENFSASASNGTRDPNLVVFCEPFKELPENFYSEGVGVTFLRSFKNDPQALSCLKSTSWLTKIMAMRELAEEGTFEGLLFNNHDQVTEGTKSNIFWVKNGILHTPPVNAGILPGITRQVVLDLAKQNHIETKDVLIDAEKLKMVDEIFLTASTFEIIPVTVLDNDKIASGEVGPMTQKIMGLYEKNLEKKIQELQNLS